MIAGIFCMLGVVALWSITPIFVKILLLTFDPFTISFLRLLQGAAVLLAVYRMTGGRLRECVRFERWHLIGGVGLGVNYALFALALNYTTASAGVLVIQIQHITLAVLAAILFGERLGWVRMAAIGLVIAGVGLITATGTGGGPDTLLSGQQLLGNAVMAVAGLGWGIYALSNRALTHRMSSIPIVLPMMLIALAITATLALIGFDLRARPTAGSVVALLILGTAATGGSIYLIAEGIRRLSAAFAGTLTGITPLAQIVLANIILGERLSLPLLAAAMLIVGGVLTIGLTERGRRADSASLAGPRREE